VTEQQQDQVSGLLVQTEEPANGKWTQMWKSLAPVRFCACHRNQKWNLRKTSLGDNENQRQNHYEHELLTLKEIIAGEPMRVHGPRPNGELEIYGWINWS
jgi:hypothetical protein